MLASANCSRGSRCKARVLGASAPQSGRRLTARVSGPDNCLGLSQGFRIGRSGLDSTSSTRNPYGLYLPPEGGGAYT